MIDFELANPEGHEMIYVNTAHVRTVRQAPPENVTPETILGLSDGSELWVRGRLKAVAAAIDADLRSMATGAR